MSLIKLFRFELPAFQTADMPHVPCIPAEPLWKITTNSFYIRGVGSDVWSAILIYIQEQGEWHAVNVRSQKGSIKVECPNTPTSAGFVVKIRLFVTDTGLLAVEWQRRHGCAFRSNDAWLRFRSHFCQPLD